MKYLQLRSKTWYYRRRVPSRISHLTPIKIIYRPLSKDRDTALKLSMKYDHLFNMIEITSQLGQDLSTLIDELKLGDAVPRPTFKPIDVFKQYADSLVVSDKRKNKVNRLLLVLKVLLPNDVSTVDMTALDKVKSKLMLLPKGNIHKYRIAPIEDVIKMDIPIEERLATETLNDYIKTLNSLLKFSYERDAVAKLYVVKTIKSTVAPREQRDALTESAVTQLLKQARSAKLGSAYALLYLTGMRPSEAYKCSVTTVEGVRCFDLTDKSIPLKTQSSYRVIPVHSSISDPEQILEDLRSFKIQNLGRQFKKDSGGGDLYSLRHSFADHLAKRVEPHLISELIGHAHKDMTKSRYIKGFGIDVLKESIEKLPGR